LPSDSKLIVTKRKVILILWTELGLEGSKMILPVSVGVLFREKAQRPEFWLWRRVEEGELNGKWEFPGGKIEPGESPKEALERELTEEVQLHVDQAQLFKIHPHQYQDRHVLLYVFLVDMTHADKTWAEESGQWVMAREDFSFPSELPILEGNKVFLNEILQYMKKSYAND
jgi:8-oxo-dGTP diphosphatase